MRIFLTALAACALLAGPAAAQAGEDRLMQMDANGDGAISRAEAQGARTAMFGALDENGDGVLSASERAGAAQDRAQRLLGRADANNDGNITRAEFMGQPYRLFDMLDGDRNGVLDAGELAAARARRGGG
jgi:Ca2+-binding EF-hand superfamily protein